VPACHTLLGPDGAPFLIFDVEILYLTMCIRIWHFESQNAAETASGKQSKGRKRKQVLMSESDDSGGDKSAPDSGSDWSQTGKQAAASSDADDDDVSMADDSDDSPAQAGKGQSSSRKRAKPTPVSATYFAFK